MRPENKKPNIIIILSDQQRWDTVSCYPSAILPDLTPNIDRLARNGIRFEHSFTCQPVCGPARSCLQTGKLATETRCFRNEIALLPGEETMAHWLTAAGYKTGYIGKWHLATTTGLPQRPDEIYWDRPVPVEKRGGYNDFWFASDVLEFTSHSYEGYLFDSSGKKRTFSGQYRADYLTDQALKFLRQYRKHEPFFLFVSFLEPHHQNDHHHFEGPVGSRHRFREYRRPVDLPVGAGDWAQEMPDYLGCCHQIDYNVGRLQKELEDLNLGDNTLVIYTSDHGCHFRTRNNEYKRSCHDASIRTPLIISGPEFYGGRVIPEMVSIVDLAPTVLAAAGVPQKKHFQGAPLQNILAGQKKDWRKEIYVQISESQVGRAIRTDKWKYAATAPHKDGWKEMTSDHYREDCLYDLLNDPHELHNLISVPEWQDLRRDLAGKLMAHMKSAGEPVSQISTQNA